MSLNLHLSDSEDTWPFYEKPGDSDVDSYVDEEDEMANADDPFVLHIPPVTPERTGRFEETVYAFTAAAIAQATNAERVVPPAKHAIVGTSDEARARVVPQAKGPMDGMRLIDLSFSGMFNNDASKRLFFMRLQQEVLKTILPGYERLTFIQVSDPIERFTSIFEGLHGWTLVEEGREDEVNAPSARYWECAHPALTFFNTAYLPSHYMLSRLERMLVASENDRSVLYQPVPLFEVQVETSAFAHLPAQDAQYQGDEDEYRPSYIRDYEAFLVVFERIKKHCRDLGNAELANDRDLIVVSIDRFVADINLEPAEAHILLAFLARLGRIYMRPLIVSLEVHAAIMEATANDPFALLEDGRSEFRRLGKEDFYYWVPNKRQENAAHSSDDEDEKGDHKRRRMDEEGRYKCANCRSGKSRYFDTLLPMCSFKCRNLYYLC